MLAILNFTAFPGALAVRAGFNLDRHKRATMVTLEHLEGCKRFSAGARRDANLVTTLGADI